MESEMIRDTELDMSEVVENVKINVSLEGWPAAVAVLGLCASVVGICVLNYKAGKM